MDFAKSVLGAFLVGGLCSVVGQIVTNVWVGVLGPDHMLFGFALLATMGLLGAVLFVIGIHQRLAKIAGFGLILPFNGFCAAVAEAYERAWRKSRSVKVGAKAALALIAYVLGLGCLGVLVVALIVYVL